jgi:hypothetical protein
VASENDPQPNRARALAGVSDDMKKSLSKSVSAAIVENRDIGWHNSKVGFGWNAPETRGQPDIAPRNFYHISVLRGFFDA